MAARRNPVRARLGPPLVIAALIAGSTAAYAFSPIPIGAAEPATPDAIPAEAFRPVIVPHATPAPPSPTPIGVLGPEPPAPIALDPTPTPARPAVVRFRPRDGWTDVSPSAAVSVRFTEPMDHASTERAFQASIDGAPIEGTVRWAEGHTVLVLQPASVMPYAGVVRLEVAAGARSRAGAVLAAPAAVTFKVEPPPAPPTPTPRPPRPTPTPRPPAVAPASLWQWPLIGPITQRFGESLTQYGFHQGIDINGETGDAVRAARGGTVTVAGHWDECGGLQIHIDHGGGIESWYRHLSRIDVRVGQRVAAGTVIGAVGNTGCSLGSHLHFAIRRAGAFVDPLDYLPPR